MRIMDLRQLEYFLRVAQRRNISTAAAELNITQPSLTKSIKLLEKELGVRLSPDRRGRAEQSWFRLSEVVPLATASGAARPGVEFGRSARVRVAKSRTTKDYD